METGVAVRHPSLPKSVTDAQLANWLKANAKERFTHMVKTIYSEDELNQKARQASAKYAETVMLDEIMSTVKFAIDKGNPENLVIEIPATDGKTAITKQMQGLNTEVSKGYISNEITIFGVPNETDKTMEFFSEVGELIHERTRSLSAKEVHDYCGFLGTGSMRAAM